MPRDFSNIELLKFSKEIYEEMKTDKEITKKSISLFLDEKKFDNNKKRVGMIKTFRYKIIESVFKLSKVG